MHSLRDATGKFPDFPEADDGGSEAIFKKREEVSEKTIATITTNNTSVINMHLCVMSAKLAK